MSSSRGAPETGPDRPEGIDFAMAPMVPRDDRVTSAPQAVRNVAGNGTGSIEDIIDFVKSRNTDLGRDTAPRPAVMRWKPKVVTRGSKVPARTVQRPKTPDAGRGRDRGGERPFTKRKPYVLLKPEDGGRRARSPPIRGDGTGITSYARPDPPPAAAPMPPAPPDTRPGVSDEVMVSPRELREFLRGGQGHVQLYRKYSPLIGAICYNLAAGLPTSDTSDPPDKYSLSHLCEDIRQLDPGHATVSLIMKEEDGVWTFSSGTQEGSLYEDEPSTINREETFNTAVTSVAGMAVRDSLRSVKYFLSTIAVTLVASGESVANVPMIARTLRVFDTFVDRFEDVFDSFNQVTNNVEDVDLLVRLLGLKATASDLVARLIAANDGALDDAILELETFLSSDIMMRLTDDGHFRLPVAIQILGSRSLATVATGLQIDLSIVDADAVYESEYDLGAIGSLRMQCSDAIYQALAGIPSRVIASMMDASAFDADVVAALAALEVSIGSCRYDDEPVICLLTNFTDLRVASRRRIGSNQKGSALNATGHFLCGMPYDDPRLPVYLKRASASEQYSSIVKSAIDRVLPLNDEGQRPYAELYASMQGATQVRNMIESLNATGSFMPGFVLNEVPGVVPGSPPSSFSPFTRNISSNNLLNEMKLFSYIGSLGFDPSSWFSKLGIMVSPTMEQVRGRMLESLSSSFSHANLLGFIEDLVLAYPTPLPTPSFNIEDAYASRGRQRGYLIEDDDDDEI